MVLWKKTLAGIAILTATILIFMSWYAIHYSMSPARELGINSPAADTRVLIATQGSAFKDSIVAGIVAHLKPLQIYVKVIDVSALPSVQESNWNAIVVIHTWQMRKPQPDAKTFIDRVRNLHKVIVLSTSGAGTFKMDGIDAISSASEMIDVPQRVTEIDTRLDTILRTPSIG